MTKKLLNALRNALRKSDQIETLQFEESNAIFSKDGKYRYALWRIWDKNLPKMMFLMLNPSTANEIKNDPTITKCIRYAIKWGYGGVYIGNLFALKSSNPEMLYQSDDPIGPDCDVYLEWMRDRCEMILASWGNHGSFMKRGDRIQRIFRKLYCLDYTNSGQPKHPLYLSYSLKPKSYESYRKYGR